PAGSWGNYAAPTAQLPKESPVRIHLRVPSDAKIWFDGSPTYQTGTDRTFESPPVAIGAEYVYQIRIQWKQDGKDVTKNQQVTIHAGDMVNLTLGPPPTYALTR